MKKNIFLLVGLLVFIGACDVSYEGNPNAPEVAPTYSIFNDAVKEMVDDSKDEWFQGRFTLGTMQYWAQTEYTEEDRYQYRESMRETWEDFYINLENFKQVIELNTNESTAGEMSKYGANANQIAACRIMMAWSFNIMADTWGDIPYWSLTTEDADFEALRIAEDILKPKYAPQSKIYPDLLKQLKEASDMIDVSKSGFTVGDAIYGGDAASWKKFANSLRLRIATKIKAVHADAATHITGAIADGVFTSNGDNAILTYEANQTNASPMQAAFETRFDFAVTNSFMKVLDGTTGVFGADPRMPFYAQENQYGDYVGIPNGVENATSVAFKWESLPAVSIIGKTATTPTNWTEGTVPLMTYSEVKFLECEANGWAQADYEAGVTASLEQWGVAAADVTGFVTALPAASMANALNQKYVALYMDGHTAWAEYRRTGYPNTLTMPGDSYSMDVDIDGAGTITTFNYTFEPINAAITDIPYRMEYPSQESTLNGANYKSAVALLSNGNEINSKLWWDVN